QILAAVAFLYDLVGQAHQGALNLRGRHQPALHSQAGVAFRFAHDWFSCRMIEGLGAPGQVVERRYFNSSHAGRQRLALFERIRRSRTRCKWNAGIYFPASRSLLTSAITWNASA